MKRCTLYFLFFFTSGVLFSQNLVPNYSFETYTSCPTSSSSEVHLAVPWMEVMSTSDYYNCSALDANLVARTGTGYMGVSTWRPGWSDTYREYIGAWLTTTLVAGEHYYCEFWVRLNSCHASDGMGALITAIPPDSSGPSDMIYTPPQVLNTQYRMLDEQTGWMKICGDFIANGTEKFITIGSFRDDNQSTFVQQDPCANSNPVHWSYYHIDDVLLEVYDTTAQYDCDDTTVYANPNGTPADSLLTECDIFIPNVISPNGDGINDEVDFSNLYPREEWTIKFYNRWGAVICDAGNLDYDSFDGYDEWHDPLPEGVYFYVLYNYTSRCYKKGFISVFR